METKYRVVARLVVTAKEVKRSDRSDSWWRSLTKAQKDKYLKEHPYSKFAKTVKSDGTKSRQKSVTTKKPPTKSTKTKNELHEDRIKSELTNEKRKLLDVKRLIKERKQGLKTKSGPDLDTLGKSKSAIENKIRELKDKL